MEDIKGIEFDSLWQNAVEIGLKQTLISASQKNEHLESMEFIFRDEKNRESIFRINTFSLPTHQLAMCMEDITSQKHMERELQQNEEKLRILVQAAAEAILIHDGNTILLSNPTFSSMFNYAEFETRTLRVEELVSAEYRKLVNEGIYRGGIESIPVMGITKDDIQFPAEITCRSTMYRGRKVGVAIFRESKELKETNDTISQSQEISFPSIIDGLTSLTNHRHFHTCLNREVERSQRNGLPLSVIMIDIDHFQELNDAYGYLAGDEVIHKLGDIFAQDRRLGDTVSRYGGEEFAIMLVDASRSAAAVIAERLRLRIADEQFIVDGYPLPRRITVSMGVAGYPEDAKRPNTLVEAAKAAMAKAKEQGRNRVVLATDSILPDTDS